MAFALSAAVPLVRAGELRGSLQGVDSLQPAAPLQVSGRRTSFWEEPNGAIDVRRPRALPDMDLSVVLTGADVAEANQPVNLSVVGGRCRPGTAVVSANTVLRIQNQDWFAREFFAVASGQSAPLSTFQPEGTASRSERQVQIAQTGSYELRDRRDPLFRCFVLVGPGQGRVVSPGTDGSYRLANVAAGSYTLRVYFEGRAVGETTTTVTGDRPVTVPPIPVSPNGPTAPAAPPAPGAAAAPPTPAPDATSGHHRRRR